MTFLQLYPQLPWRPDPLVYDCSNRSFEEWTARGTAHPIMGGFSVMSGSFILVLYLLVVTAMSNREFLKHPCYQLMYFTSLNDILNLLGSNFATGYFMIVGATFCTHPISNYFIGSLATAAWCSSCLAVLSLGLGRLSEVTGYGKFMFEGKMASFWISLCIMYFVFMATMSRPMLFNSTAGTYIPAPLIIDDLAEELKTYQNILLPTNNLVIPLLLAVTYILIFISLMRKQKVANDGKTSTVQKKEDKNVKLLLQCTVICLTQALVGFSFFCLIVFPMPHWFLLVAQGFFQLNECSPPVACLIFNITIRKRVMVMLGLRSSSVSSSNTAPKELTGSNTRASNVKSNN